MKAWLRFATISWALLLVHLLYIRVRNIGHVVCQLARTTPRSTRRPARRTEASVTFGAELLAIRCVQMVYCGIDTMPSEESRPSSARADRHGDRDADLDWDAEDWHSFTVQRNHVEPQRLTLGAGQQCFETGPCAGCVDDGAVRPA